MSQFGYTPCTNFPVLDELLARKIARRLPANARLGSLKGRVSADHLGLKSISVNLPEIDLQALSIEDVLELRVALHDELRRFRLEMVKLATRLRTEPYEPGFSRDVERVVRGEVEPAVLDLEAKLAGVARKFPLRFVRSARTGALPIVVTVFAGMPLSAVLALSAGVVALEAWWEGNIERKELLDTNGLQYLLRLRSRA